MGAHSRFFFVFALFCFFLFLHNNVFFCFCSKKSSSGGMDLIFFKKVPPNFSPSSGTRENLSTRPEGSGKTEKLNFNKFAENNDGAKKNSSLSQLLFVRFH